MPGLSIIICTYNPNEEIFSRCLDCILTASRQFLPLEVIIVDNNSHTPVSAADYVREFLNQCKNSRIIIEKKQGLTPARLRGIKESTGDILAFIDDDNFSSPDFFVNAMRISERNLHIGSFSGQVKLIFENEPPAWTRRYWGLLVYREFKGNRWSNLPHLPDTMPCGAGLIVRKEVAEEYARLHEKGKRNIQLDRTAGSLFSAGDNDLAACACDIGLGVGIFDSLIIDHYIPAGRTTKEYLIKLAEGIAHSAVIFRSFRGELPQEPTFKRTVAKRLRLMLKGGVEREFQRAVYKGENDARLVVRNIKKLKFEDHPHS